MQIKINDNIFDVSHNISLSLKHNIFPITKHDIQQAIDFISNIDISPSNTNIVLLKYIIQNICDEEEVFKRLNIWILDNLNSFEKSEIFIYDKQLCFDLNHQDVKKLIKLEYTLNEIIFYVDDTLLFDYNKYKLNNDLIQEKYLAEINEKIMSD